MCSWIRQLFEMRLTTGYARAHRILSVFKKSQSVERLRQINVEGNYGRSTPTASSCSANKVNFKEGCCNKMNSIHLNLEMHHALMYVTGF